MQGELPKLSLYLPTAHAVQLPVDPEYPALQDSTQLLSAALPGGDSVFAGHAVHADVEEL